MVSQFVSSDDVPLLGDLQFSFPAGTHAIGRLDKNSEGLLLLTTDKSITRLLFSGDRLHKRSYLVMLQHVMPEETFQQLARGVMIKIKNGEDYLARPYSIERISDPLALYKWAHDVREAYPHTWILITLTQGKYHQVRKMAMAVKQRCLRLIRLKMEDIAIEHMPPGTVKELTRETFFRLAGLENSKI